MTAAAKNPGKPRRSRGTGRRPGRPTREEAERRRLMALGVDPTFIDPRRIAAAIAIDETAQPTARVAALRLLIATGASAPAPEAGVPIATVADEPPPDELTRRALELMSRGRPQ